MCEQFTLARNGRQDKQNKHNIPVVFGANAVRLLESRREEPRNIPHNVNEVLGRYGVGDCILQEFSSILKRERLEKRIKKRAEAWEADESDIDSLLCSDAVNEQEEATK